MSSKVEDDIPQGDAKDNEYVSRTGQSEIPVQKDEAPVEDPIDPATADTDEQLGSSIISSTHFLNSLFSSSFFLFVSPFLFALTLLFICKTRHFY